MLVTRGDDMILSKLAFRVDELVLVLGLGKTKIRQLIDRGDLDHIRVGAAILVTEGQLRKFLTRC